MSNTTTGLDSGTDDLAGERESDDDRRRVVLLVEDNEVDRDVYGGLLWYNGYEVLHSPDGETAIRTAMEAEPDLILLDIRLSGALSGLDVARELQRRGMEVPMVALSALSAEEVADEVAESGIALFLEKPIDPFTVVTEVIRRIGHATDRRPSD